jgi:predicted TIM-barrel fold metal-dependent hydrolase
MDLKDYRPQSRLVTKRTLIIKPRFPVIDMHNHLGASFGGGWDKKPVSELLDVLDQAGVQVYVDLDGGWGETILNEHLDHFKAAAPERFKIFGGVNWDNWAEQGNFFPELAAKRLRLQKERGAEGLKIWKHFGLKVCDHKGNLVTVDDPRLDVIWQTAAELNLPVLIHVADPVAFFDPVDATNERWEELQVNPDWAFTSPPFPSFLSIVEAFHRLVKRNVQTQFVGAHMGQYAENLAWVGNMLDDCPNLSVDIGARIAELGRQPYTARKFMIQYADRIVFGTDFGPDLETYRIHFRFLETDDEYFSATDSEIPGMGRWYIYGVFLPDQALQKIYYQNSARIFGMDAVL